MFLCRDVMVNLAIVFAI